MGHYKFERLSAQDTSFLIFEKPNINMHVASTSIYETGPLQIENGGIDFACIKEGIDKILHLIPRYRQKIKWIEEGKTAAWIDDHEFVIDYHVRHTSLPNPGTEEQLRQLVSRITEHQLDRSRPLWEMWVVEGLENDRFALINKVHHCMIDGASGVDLSQVIMSPDPKHIPEKGPAFYPRPEPTHAELKRGNYKRLAAMPWQAFNRFGRHRRKTDHLAKDIKEFASGLKETMAAMGIASETPLNGPLGPHRTFSWNTMPLDDLRTIRRSMGCTINDVVLAIVTNAVRNFFISRQTNPDNVPFRIAAPVNMRKADDRRKMGNRVSAWSVPLPIAEDNPIKQLMQVRCETRKLRDSKQANVIEMIMSIAEFAPSMFSMVDRLGSISGSNNSIVTNVPGPQFPLYFFGAKMLEIYPCVPLLENMGLGIALMSYDGKVCWGYNADYGQLSDLSSFTDCIQQSLKTLAKAAQEHASSNEMTDTASGETKPKRRRKARSTKIVATTKTSKTSKKVDLSRNPTSTKAEIPSQNK